MIRTSLSLLFSIFFCKILFSVNYSISGSLNFNTDSGKQSFVVAETSSADPEVNAQVYVATYGSDTTGSGTKNNPYATIQKGINSATNGQIIGVEAGTYSGTGNKALNFNGKHIKLVSLKGPTQTIIDCSGTFLLKLINGENSNTLIKGFTFQNGSLTNGSDHGSAILVELQNCNAVIEDCVFKNNSAVANFQSGTGTAILFKSTGGSPKIKNCLIRNNLVKGGDNSKFSNLFRGTFSSIENCTIINNTVDALMTNWWYFIRKSIVDIFSTNSPVKNCIIWGNQVSVIGPRNENSPATSPPPVPVVSYSIYEGGFSGTGNLNTNPSLNSANNYLPQSGSSAIDGGNPLSTLDPDGTRNDMGWKLARFNNFFAQTLKLNFNSASNFTFTQNILGGKPWTIFAFYDLDSDGIWDSNEPKTIYNNGNSITVSQNITNLNFNLGPYFVFGSNQYVSNENSLFTGIIVNSNLGNNTTSNSPLFSVVGGVDGAKFNINGSTGELSFKAVPDYENPTDLGANNSYVVDVRASDGQLYDEQTITVNVTDVNETPIINSNGGGVSASKNVSENQTGVTTVSATDPDAGTTLSYSISGGVDAGKFQINGNTGVLSFKAAPDFENPIDSGSNNGYVVRVRASDGSLHDEQTITVSVTDVVENLAPTIVSNGGGSSASKNVSENQTGVTTVSATDPDAGTTLSYSISGGVDAGKFQINGNTGVLSFKTAPNYESPTDSGANNGYVVKVRASDGALHDEQTITVNVNNVNESPNIMSNGGGNTASKNVSENQTGVTTVSATDPDAGTTITYSITGGVDAAKFQINGNTGALSFKTAPNYESPTDSGANNGYVVKVRASDGALHDEQTITVNVTNVNEYPSITSNGAGNTASKNVSENQTGVTTVSATDPDAGTTITYSITGGVDAAKFQINGNTGVLSFKTAPNYESPTDSGANNSYVVKVRASDGALHDEQTITVNVQNSNDAPDDLFLSNFSVAENQSVGSLIGLFSASDEDGLSDLQSMNFQFVNDSGDNDNPSFSLETNGTLLSDEIFDFEQKSSYQIRVKGTDPAGGSISKSFTINIIDLDDTPPVISINGSANIIHEGGINYVDPGASWTDAVDGNGSLSANGIVDSMKVGFYQLNYSRTDQAGNSAIKVFRTVQVVDRTAPSLILNGSRKAIQQVWREYKDPWVFSHDRVDGNLTSKVSKTGEVKIDQPGIYLLKYEVSDQSGNQAIPVFREVEVVNQAPNGLIINNNLVEENLPSQSIIGIFNTLDPDDSNGTRNYKYELINIQSGSEQPFSLTSDGILRTAMVFDFEKKNKYSIRVRTTDQFGGNFEKDFPIEIVDCFRPMVETRGVIDLNGTGYRFSGEVVDGGGSSGILEKGFVWSLSPRPMIDQNGSFKIVSNGSGLKFNKVVKDLIAGKKYFFRAYARNKEGVGYGPVLDLRTVRNISPWWIDARSGAATNWWTSSWLGSFYMNEANASWIMHSEMGWLYPMESPKSGVWLWKENLGWLWTDEEFYPFLYQNSSAGWLYFYGASQGKKLFYHYRDERWLQMNNGEQSD